MKKIRVLLTGGTIGSQSHNGIIDLKKEGSALVDLYRTDGRKDVVFDCERLADMLSENASVEDLVDIVNAIAATDKDEYCGVIVAYGTDTLAYAAAFAAMALPANPLPAVFVASDKPLDEAGANGVINFAAAVDFIAEGVYTGIYAIYKNPGEKIIVHLGSRILQSEALTGRFTSAKGVCFGEMSERRFVRGSDAANPFLEEITDKKIAYGKITSKPPFVLYLKPCPGTDFGVYDFTRVKPVAVVAELYHSGTGCVSGMGKSLAEFIKRCKTEGIPVVLASYPYSDGRKYASAKALEEAGGIFAIRMSAEAAYAKTLIYFLRKIKKSLADFLAEDAFFEILD